jgi:hypothetical protein
MSTALSLADVRRAFDARDPDLADLVVRLAAARDPRPEAPPREGAMTLSKLRVSLRTPEFKRKSRAEQHDNRVAWLRALEGPDAESSPPPRLALHTILDALWAADDAYSRAQLLKIVAEVPLKWGPWKALKRIFKEAQARQDLEMFGALTARFDTALAVAGGYGEVSRRTLAYLARRAWRFLRTLGESLPAVYADAAVEVLRFYPDSVNWSNTWVANHIFYHETGSYARGRFTFRRRPSTLLKHRAFPDLWRRTPRPLFSLLERAESEQARRFATTALKSDFRATLRDVEPTWVTRLIPVASKTVHDFVVWILENVPRFEQAAFVELGLREPVLSLFDSPSDAARAYAAAYARAHVRDLALSRLIELANNDHDGVRAMARDLLRDRDPRKGVGLEAWGQLLGTHYGHALATAALTKHFGARELKPIWFAERLASDHRKVVDFAIELLPKVHPTKKLGLAFFTDLLARTSGLRREATRFALDALETLGVGSLSGDVIRRALIDPATRQRARGWITEERLPAADLGVEFLQTLADPQRWQADAYITDLKNSDAPFADELDEPIPALATMAFALLADVRTFSPDQLGFEWLLSLVERIEPEPHAFAVEYMTRAFIPADFAPADDSAPAEAAPTGEINVDLGGAKFLFTGKLATMTRSEAKKKVSSAGGANSGTVAKTLDYLVIGDEGSSLYGLGRKGSKQVKAEKLIEAGAALRIISETAFLQMLAGEQRGGDDDATAAGAERIWEMAFGAGDAEAPAARFARHYIRMHHQKICPAETDRYVDPGAEMPDDFLSFERIEPLLNDAREPVRRIALELSGYEFGRWQPAMEALVTLSESGFDEVRAFVSTSLSADPDDRDADAYRINADRLTADAVYRFCESLDPSARALGMQLIGAHPRLALPTELFRLTESPDRRMRAFVIRQLWSIYRAPGVTLGWQAPTPKDGEVPAPLSRPDAPPAGGDDIRAFVRRTLFGIPPARPKPGKGAQGRPLPARKAKLALIEVVRDLAVEDAAFAALVMPLFETFLQSRGASERAACLVALTRVRAAHPHLAGSEAA